MRTGLEGKNGLKTRPVAGNEAFEIEGQNKENRYFRRL
jgi:hypothetical protein